MAYRERYMAENGADCSEMSELMMEPVISAYHGGM